MVEVIKKEGSTKHIGRCIIWMQITNTKQPYSYRSWDKRKNPCLLRIHLSENRGPGTTQSVTYWPLDPCGHIIENYVNSHLAWVLAILLESHDPFE